MSASATRRCRPRSILTPWHCARRRAVTRLKRRMLAVLAGARARWGAGALGASVLGTTQWSLQSRIRIDAPGSGAWSSADASPPIGRTGQVGR